MKVDRVDDSRFETALALLLDRVTSLEIDGVGFWIDREHGLVYVNSLSTWAYRVTEESALADISRGVRTFELLQKESRGFAEAVEGLAPRFSLISDYDMGTVEVCHLDDGELVWSAKDR